MGWMFVLINQPSYKSTDSCGDHSRKYLFLLHGSALCDFVRLGALFFFRSSENAVAVAVTSFCIVFGSEIRIIMKNEENFLCNLRIYEKIIHYFSHS